MSRTLKRRRRFLLQQAENKINKTEGKISPETICFKHFYCFFLSGKKCRSRRQIFPWLNENTSNTKQIAGWWPFKSNRRGLKNWKYKKTRFIMNVTRIAELCVHTFLRTIGSGIFLHSIYLPVNLCSLKVCNLEFSSTRFLIDQKSTFWNQIMRNEITKSFLYFYTHRESRILNHAK